MLVLGVHYRADQLLRLYVFILHEAAGVSQHAFRVFGDVVVKRLPRHLDSLSACRQAAVMVLQVHLQCHFHLSRILV